MNYPTDLVNQGREQLKQLADTQLALFKQDQQHIQALLFARSDAIDNIILTFWHFYLSPEEQQSMCLIATGGYGRAELHLGSDIDIMVLVKASTMPATLEKLSQFLTVLWDIGLEVGHAVRTAEETVAASKTDITIATCIQESRLISGDQASFNNMLEMTGPNKLWSSATFFQAKFEEQERRHQRYRGTAYNLEPNIKGNIGGLRDLQVIAWVLKRHFDANSFTELVGKGFLTKQEHKELNRARDFLWTIRFALHAINGRREDRLLFDNQIKVAEMLNYVGSDTEKPVEAFMRDYYRTAMSLSRLNEMLLQMFREVIVEKDRKAIAHSLEFGLINTNEYLDIDNPDAFAHDPSLMLKVFITWQNRSHLQGITARTIRGLTENLALINDEFRADPQHQALFLQLFSKPDRLFNTLLRMNRIGILGQFFPAFGKIVGHMQFDLFHAYTVDAHTLFVIKELQNLCLDEADNKQIAYALKNIDCIQTLLLSGLFHDIAKGRGGDHSHLGADEVLHFARTFKLKKEQTALLSWLVRYHLLLSVTAQKKDIDDPAVIKDFADNIPQPHYLHYLYLLTIADVKGTNPKLWTSWKASLFARLYQGTVAYFKHKNENILSPIDSNRALALDGLQEFYSEARIKQAWSHIDDEYFLRHQSDEIIWHTQILLKQNMPIVATREHNEKLVDQQRLQSLDIFIACTYSPQAFSRLASALTELHLDIYSAKLFRNEIPIRDNIVTAITFRVREAHLDIRFDRTRIQAIETHLYRVVNLEHTPLIKTHVNKRAQLFNIPTSINFGVDPSKTYTTLEVKTADRSGLLALISQCIAAVNADINLAKIMTIGERAEDVFYISNNEKTLLNAQQQRALSSKIHAELTLPSSILE